MKDEIVIKNILLYQGGTWFGRANYDPQSLEKNCISIDDNLVNPHLFLQCCSLKNPIRHFFMNNLEFQLMPSISIRVK